MFSGFTSANYSYLLVIQPGSTAKLENKITRIIHTCQSDQKLYSYIDLPLDCRHGNKLFNLVTAGKVIIPGTRLKANLNLTTMSDDVLVATFTDDERNSSAVCVFSMADVRKMAVVNVKKCRSTKTTQLNAIYLSEGAECENVSVYFY